MLKLLKYEFRKALTGLLVMLGATAALEAYFLISLYTEAGDGLHATIAAVLLVLMTIVVYIFVLIRGVISYSGELKSRSSYLIFMTPNSTLKIMGSKYLFTFLLGALFSVLYAALGYLDIRLLLEKFGAYQEFLDQMNDLMRQMGVYADQIVLAGVFAVIYATLSMLSFFAVAYLAVTLSHTFFRDKSWRWLMAIVFYIAINYGIGFLNSLFPMAYAMLHFNDAPGTMAIIEAYGIDTTPDFSDLWILIVPQALISLGTILVSFFGCAWMLDRKVSL